VLYVKPNGVRFSLGHHSAAEWADLEPYFEDAIVFVEWPEAGAASLPEVRVAVTLEHAGGDERRIALASSDEALVQGVL